MFVLLEFDSCLVKIPSLGVTKAWFVVECDWSVVGCRAFVLNPRSLFSAGLGMVPSRNWVAST